MKKISLGIACCMLLAMILFNSCSKEGPAGATGPAGPQGPAGAAGAAGTAGAAGAKGDTGVANVIYSAWLDAAFLPDTVHTGNIIDTVGFFTNISAPKMTANILTRGEIKVYLNLGSAASPTVVPIPYFDVYTNISINPYFFISTAGVGTIQLYSNTNIVQTVTSNGVKFQQYRYVLIPGGVPARSIINWNDYKAVKEYLHLTD